MTTNVFVPGLDDLLLRELETVRSDDLRFHGLLDMDTLITAPAFDFEDLLARARAELEAFPGSIDAIIAHWDFPTSLLAPILCHDVGIPAPSIRSLVLCEHKYASRVMQAEAVPECVPGFALFDPADPDALDQIDLAFPFWVKPVKSHSSQLGFEVRDPDEFATAAHEMTGGVEQIADAFDTAMEHADLPPGIAGVSARMGLAEQLIDGVQAAPEGSMANGAFHVHGLFDMPRTGEHESSFERLDYPSSLPASVQDRMGDVCERYLRHVGFDDGCFNVEFLHDEDADQLWLVEVNTRISQSHSALFAKVDGRSNHEIALDVALRRPPQLPDERGPFEVASKILVGREDDGVVTRVASDAEIDQLREAYPGTEVRIEVEVGDRLSDLPNQDPNRYVLAEVYVGADDREQLEAGHRRCLELLTFEFEDPREHHAG